MLRSRPVQPPGRCLAAGPDLNVQAIRQKVGGTPAEFAVLIGVPHGTLRNWEHRRRQPTGSARVLSRLAESDPDLFLALLTESAKGLEADRAGVPPAA
jgi:putative transcriptional regulator